MKILLLNAILIAGAAAYGWRQHHDISQLRHRHSELLQSARQIEKHKSQSPTAHSEAFGTAPSDGLIADPAELAALRASWTDLMKLRAEIGALRQASKLDLPSLQHELEATLEKTKAEQDRRDNLMAQRAAKQQAALTRNCLDSLLNALRFVAKSNAGKLPASFQQFDQLLSALPEPTRQNISSILSQSHQLPPAEAELTGTNFNVSTDSFEFVPSARPLTAANPPALLLREKSPRQLPDGSWTRFYGLSNGKITEATSADGDFARWEQQQQFATP